MQITLLWDILIFRFPLISWWRAVTRWLAVAWSTYDQSFSFSGSWFQFSIFHHQASAKSSADNPNTHCLMLNIQNIQNISDLWLTGGHMMEERDGEGENICLAVYSWSGDDREVWHSTEQHSPSLPGDGSVWRLSQRWSSYKQLHHKLSRLNLINSSRFHCIVQSYWGQSAHFLSELHMKKGRHLPCARVELIHIM